MSALAQPTNMDEARAVVARLRNAGAQTGDLRVDSREIQPGDIFVALPGASNDGGQFISKAIAAGAKAVIKDDASKSSDAKEITQVPLITVAQLAVKLGLIAGEYYQWPGRRIPVYGVTGTNGKTTVSWWLQQMLNALDMPCAVVGTLGAHFDGMHVPSMNTTPDAASVQRTLSKFIEAGAKAAAMEVSSHALEQYRVSGLSYEAAILTNLTRDHLDFHGSMEAYAAAKTRLFTEYEVAHRIINADDALGMRLIGQSLPNTLTYGIKNGEVRAEVVAMNAGGMQLNLSTPWGSAQFFSSIVGEFNVYNMLAVIASLLASGYKLDNVVEKIELLEAAPGRLQRVTIKGVEPRLPIVYVDYAHTPDALEKALTTLRQISPKKLTVVFGCGGDRDRSKRPIMGRTAVDHADQIVVTSDNPRSESPAQIVQDICADFDPALVNSGRILICLDRKLAIAKVIANASESDIVLIAGKGHETYQEIQKVRYPLSDVSEVTAALQQRVVSHGALNVE